MYLVANPPKLFVRISVAIRAIGRFRGHWNILDFVKDHARGLVDSKQPDHRRNKGEECERPVVRGGKIEDVVVLNTFRGITGGRRGGLLAVLRSGRATGRASGSWSRLDAQGVIGFVRHFVFVGEESGRNQRKQVRNEIKIRNMQRLCKRS